MNTPVNSNPSLVKMLVILIILIVTGMNSFSSSSCSSVPTSSREAAVKVLGLSEEGTVSFIAKHLPR